MLSIISAMGSGKIETLAGLQRSYNCLAEPSHLAHALLLADAGYLSRDYLATLIQERAQFIIKAESKINPLIESYHTPTKRNKKLLGMKLKSAFSHLSKETPNDLIVQWQTSDGDWFTCRLIVTWNPSTQCYQYLATNLPRSRYSPARIIEAYRLRWQIKLLFQEWKSYTNLKSFNMGKPQFVEGLIWVAVMAVT